MYPVFEIVEKNKMKLFSTVLTPNFVESISEVFLIYKFFKSWSRNYFRSTFCSNSAFKSNEQSKCFIASSLD